jgi:phage antirepressor YoqD-like protein
MNEVMNKQDEQQARQLEALVQAEVDRRLADPVYLRDMVVHLSDTLQARERELAALAPAKEFYEAVTNSDDWMEMSAVVKVLGYKGWGRNNVFKLLREREVLRYNNEPYQQYVERGYFKTIEQVFETACGESMINRKTMVSQRGLDFIRKLIAEEITA